MAKTLSGLFTGPSAADVRMAMGLESDARIRQAGEDAKAGGFIPSYIARARQKGVEALQPLMGAGIQFFGGEVPQDPRLAKALKREKDKKEIMAILEGYRKSDGIIDETEIEKGWSLLMSRGYIDEAKEFRLRAEGILKNKNALKGQTTKAIGSGDTLHLNAEEAEKWGLPKKATYAKFIPVIEGNKVVIKVKAMPGKPTAMSDRDDPDKQSGAQAKQTGREIPKRETIKYEETLERETLSLKQKLNIDEDAAKELASLNLKDRSAIINSGLTAAEDLPKLKALVELARLRKAGKTGGDLQAAFRRLGRAFGYENKKFADFRVGSQNLMIENLKRIFGPRATDKDMEELRKAFANENQTYEGNLSILESLLKKYEREVDNTTFLTNNPLAAKVDLFEYVRGGRKVPTEAANNLLREKRIELRNNPEEWKKITKQYRNLYGNLALKKALKNRD